MRRNEFVNFLIQDTVTYSTSCKWYAGKKFLIYTWQKTHEMYLEQEQFHTHGIISKSTMRAYKPDYVKLSGDTLLSQCLCDHCENCDLIMKSLLSNSIRRIPDNKYKAVD